MREANRTPTQDSILSLLPKVQSSLDDKVEEVQKGAGKAQHPSRNTRVWQTVWPSPALVRKTLSQNNNSQERTDPSRNLRCNLGGTSQEEKRVIMENLGWWVIPMFVIILMSHFNGVRKRKEREARARRYAFRPDGKARPIGSQKQNMPWWY